MTSTQISKDLHGASRAIMLFSNDIVAASRVEVANPGSGFARRSYFRAVFAMIEGSVNSMALVLDGAASRGEVDFSEGERAVLRGESYILTDKGAVKTGRLRPPFKSKVRFVLPRLGQLLGRSHHVTFDGAGWAMLGEALAVRHRITHPKTAASFDVTKEEIGHVDTAKTWFFGTMEKLFLRESLRQESSEAGQDGPSPA